MRSTWTLATALVSIGLIYVCVMPSDAQAETVQTIVDLIHSAPNARDGETY